MLLKVLLVVAALVVGLVALVATRQADFQITRTALVAAPAEVIYAQVADFHRWDAWSPWGKLDPAMKTTFQGTDGTPGASYYWTGNDKVGEGRMTVESVQPPRELNLKLEFLRPFAATNASTFRFAPEAGGTRVLWTMSGKNNFMAKAAGMFMNMDALIGGDFERGLASLKAVSEATAAQGSAAAAAGAAPAAPSAAAAAPAAPAAGDAKSDTKPAGGVAAPY